MNRFNIALIPSNPVFQELFARLAQTYFSTIQDEYILGENALAHITLCQFFADTEQAAVNAYSTFVDKAIAHLFIHRFNLRKGEGRHTGKFWAEFLVDREPDLLERQRKCYHHLIENDLRPLTPVETYSPHVTLARISHEVAELPLISLIPERRFECYLALGNSSENGKLVNIIKV